MSNRLKSTMFSSAGWLGSRLMPRCVSLLGGDRENTLRVLTYHRIDWPDAREDLCRSTLSATPASFAAQMEYVRDSCHPVSLDEVCAAAKCTGKLPPRAVLITFDDAYCDFQEHAWPVLRRLELPATLFVPTAFAEESQRVFWWDRLHQIVSHWPAGKVFHSSMGKFSLASPKERSAAQKQITHRIAQMPHGDVLSELDRLAVESELPPAPRAVLNWDELRGLAQQGVSLAPHTHTHPLLDRIPLTQVRDELQISRAQLRDHTGCSPAVFSYPGGAYSADVVRILQEEGIEVAFTTRRGANLTGKSDWLRLRRMNVGRTTNVNMLATQLAMPPAMINRLCGA